MQAGQAGEIVKQSSAAICMMPAAGSLSVPYFTNTAETGQSTILPAKTTAVAAFSRVDLLSMTGHKVLQASCRIMVLQVTLITKVERRLVLTR